MSVSRQLVAELVVIFIILLSSSCPAQIQQSEAGAAEPLVSAMLTDLARCDAHGSNPNLRALAVMLKAAAELDENNFEAAILLCETLETLGDRTGAGEAISRYIALQPEDEVVWAKGISMLLESLQTNEERLGYLSNMAGRSGIPVGIQGVLFQEMARLSFEGARDEVGMGLVNKAISVDEYNLAARQKMLESMGPQSPIQQRLMILAQMVRINPLRLQVVWQFATTLDELGLHTEAQKWYKYAMGVHLAGASPGDISGEELLDLASSYVLSQDYEQAMMVFDLLLKQHPQRVDVRIWLARATAGMGDKEQSQKHLSIAERVLLERAKKNPSDGTALTQVAWFYLQDKPITKKAIYWSEKALTLAPESKQAQLCMGLSMLADGQIDSARSHLEMLIAENAWARLGMVRLAMAEEHTEEQLLEVIQIAFSQHPGDWVGFALRELAKTQGVDIDMDVYLQRYRQGLEFALGNEAQLRDFYRNPQGYLFLKIQPNQPEYSYGEPLLVRISLTNLGPLTIGMGPGMMLRPQLLLSARLSGGLEKELKYYDFVSLYKKRRVDPGQGLNTIVRLDRGELGMLLRGTPQGTVTIKLSSILDPQVVGENEYLPSLAGQMGKETVLMRHGFRPNVKNMERVYHVLKVGAVKNKIHSLMLLGDLLGNSQNPQPLAKKPLAVNEEQIGVALIEAGREGNWRVRACLGEALRFVNLDEHLSKALADQIRDEHWLVRLMAVRAAGQRGGDWTEVLRRVSQTDSSQLVQEMAQSYLQAESVQ